MAGLTFRAIAALMNVIFSVATGTRCVERVGEWVVAVAVIAGQHGVLELQREVRLAVIKTGVVPIAGIVAIVALITTAPVVRVILCMASNTGGRRVLVRLIRVTVGTARLLVPAEQRVPGSFMIESNVKPIAGVMAIVAAVPKKALVNIVIQVAVDTNIGCVTMPGRRLVAPVAGCVYMFAE